MRSGLECLFVMVCETRPLPVYPIVFRHSGLPVAGKHSVFNLIHRHVCSFLLVSLIWHPASNLRRRGWWKNRLQYFEFGLQYLVQPLGVNPTYSTFKMTYLWFCFLQTHSFSLHNTFIDGLDSCGLLVDYCDAFFSSAVCRGSKWCNT